MIKKKISYTLLPTNNELDKRWFIKVKVFNINTLSVEYLRKYGSRLNRFRTVEARLLVYPQVLASIDEELQNNATYWGSIEEYETHKLRKKSYTSLRSKINNLHNSTTKVKEPTFFVQTHISSSRTKVV